MISARLELAAYIRERHLSRPLVVGHSLGGTLALALASDHPDRLGPLVIVDALPFFAGPLLEAKSLDEARPGIERCEAIWAS